MPPAYPTAASVTPCTCRNAFSTPQKHPAPHVALAIWSPLYVVNVARVFTFAQRDRLPAQRLGRVDSRPHRAEDVGAITWSAVRSEEAPCPFILCRLHTPPMVGRRWSRIPRIAWKPSARRSRAWGEESKTPGTLSGILTSP